MKDRSADYLQKVSEVGHRRSTRSGRPAAAGPIISQSKKNKYKQNSQLVDKWLCLIQ